MKPPSTLVLALSLTCLASLGQVASGEQAGTLAAVPDTPVVVRIYFEPGADIQPLTTWLDVWEVDWRARYLVAPVDPEAYAELLAMGYHLRVEEELSRHLLVPPGYPCYRTVEEIQSAMAQLVQEYPGLVELIDYGDSWEKVQDPEAGYDLLALKIANQAMPGPKPAFFLDAEHHAREMTTPEAAMAFALWLLEGYGIEPDATWLVDYQETYVIPFINPDGRKLAEEGYWQRKNTNDTNGGSCSVPPDPGNQHGVDINRNYDFKWGCCGGSSGDPCAQTYRGPSAASEPETYSYADLVRSVIPDQRGPSDTDPVPITATGTLLSMHSYSNLVLWPWGWTEDLPPNSEALTLLGQKLASFNGYTACGAGLPGCMYSVDGDTMDWAYGELGAAAYTFELGESFFQPCEGLQDIIAENLPAFRYLARVSRAPYAIPFGPDPAFVQADPPSGPPGMSVLLTAEISDEHHGGQVVAAAEAYADGPPWAGGTPVPMQPVDGAFDSPLELAAATLDTAGWAEGRHLLFVRGQDLQGTWGAVSAVFVDVLPSAIAGQATDADTGNALGGVSVTAWGSEPFPRVTTTGPTGVYTLPVPAGTFSVTASLYAYHTQVVTDVVVPPGETVPLDVRLAPIVTGRLLGTVTSSGTGLPLPATITFPGDPAPPVGSDAFTGSYSTELLPGIYTVHSAADYHAAQVITNVQILPGQVFALDLALDPVPCILLVDHDGYAPVPYQRWFTETLATLDVPYDLRMVTPDGSASPTFDDLAPYGVVIWHVGNSYTAATENELAALAQYLDGGGRLLISGAGTSNLAGTEFYQDYLKADLVDPDVDWYELAGSAFLQGVSVNIQYNPPIGDGAHNQFWPGEILPLDTADGILDYTAPDVGWGALAHAGNEYRVVHLAFGFEGINAAAARTEVLSRSLEFLGGCPAVPQVAVHPPQLAAELLPTVSRVLTLSVGNQGDLPLGFSLWSTPAVGWLTLDPPTGVVPGRRSREISVALEAAGLVPGVYTATLDLHAPLDVEHPHTAVPVELTVVPGYRRYLPLLLKAP